MVAFYDHYTPRLLIFRDVVLVIGLVLLYVYSDLRSVKGQLRIKIIANIRIDIRLIPQNFVLALGPQKNLIDRLLYGHFFVVIISGKAFDFVSEFGHQLKHSLELLNQQLVVMLVVLSNIDIVDVDLRTRVEGLQVHRRHHYSVW